MKSFVKGIHREYETRVKFENPNPQSLLQKIQIFFEKKLKL